MGSGKTQPNQTQTQTQPIHTLSLDAVECEADEIFGRRARRRRLLAVSHFEAREVKGDVVALEHASDGAISITSTARENMTTNELKQQRRPYLSFLYPAVSSAPWCGVWNCQWMPETFVESDTAAGTTR
jgi:hypothetical protein